MRATIRAAGGDVLVTLGQDEGGIHERATQQVLGEALDYRPSITWWKNDDLLWDGVLTKVIGKPSLHQETGLMRLEHVDGTPWRTPEEAARLLERKLGYAFAARGTGVVEWVWNINPYMPLDEETTIGLFRPDGTAKPGARRPREVRALLRGRRAVPRGLRARSGGAPRAARARVPGPAGRDRRDETGRACLAERFGVVPSAMSDLRLEAARLRDVKLVLVPNPTVLDAAAADALVQASRRGTKVLVTARSRATRTAVRSTP